MNAATAAATLGVSRDTLYAYVSRGLLRSTPDPADPRARRYAAADVVRLRDRRGARHGREEELANRRMPAAGAPGVPSVESAITLIRDGRLYYRGHDVAGLARTRRFEDVAELLWLGPSPATAADPQGPPAGADVEAFAARVAAHLDAAVGDTLTPFEAMQAALPLEAARDLGALDLRPTGVAATSRRILALFGPLVAPVQAPIAARNTDGAPDSSTAGISAPWLAARLARAWAPNVPGAARLLDAALVLVADHGVNAAAFTARSAASAGASPHRALAAGLAALQGAKHGGDVGRVHRLLAEVAAGADPLGAAADYLARGERVPGFRHALYPGGDPRAAALLGLIGELRADAPAAAAASRLAAAVAGVTGDRPTVDLALAATAAALGAPAHAPRTLFALGRTAGLLAHALEQYGQGPLPPPHTAYVGAEPAAEPPP